MTVPKAAAVTMRVLAVMVVICGIAVIVAADCQQTDRRGIEWIAAEGDSPSKVRFIHFFHLFSSKAGHAPHF